MRFHGKDIMIKAETPVDVRRGQYDMVIIA